MMKRILLAAVVILLTGLAACAPAVSAPAPAAAAVVSSTPMVQATTLTPFQPATHTPTRTPTETPMPTSTPTRTPRPMVTATPEWHFHQPGEVVAPILLYHHVVEGEPENLYSVSIDTLRTHMQTLKEKGYTAISVTTLVKAIREGADLPERPVVITFDDGYEEVFTNAYPVLRQYGFTATAYLVSDYVGQVFFLTPDEIHTLAGAGWEFGSHSISHAGLAGKGVNVAVQEVSMSQVRLKKQLGLPIETFAYPYGLWDGTVMDVVKAKYIAGMGLGTSNNHSLASIEYLSRFVVRSDTTLDEFVAQLPWH